MRSILVAFLGVMALLSCPANAGTAKPLPHSVVVIDTAHGPVRFSVEVASNAASQERGLMYRRSLAPNAGMLFDFHHPRTVTFWMRNTIIPLDMIFIRANGTISTIHANATPYSLTPIPSAEPIRAVLEINGGQSAKLGIQAGNRVHNPIFGRP
jgi:uncharacterized membrane protein (UPF0127 family)